MTDSWTTVRFRDGYGRAHVVELTLSADRYARLVCPSEAGPLVFDGWLAEGVFPELCSRLRDAGFPSFPQVPEDPRKALLSIATQTSTLQAWVELAHREIPLILRAVVLVEGIASALSHETLPAYKPLARTLLAAPGRLSEPQ